MSGVIPASVGLKAPRCPSAFPIPSAAGAGRQGSGRWEDFTAGQAQSLQGQTALMEPDEPPPGN